MRRTDGGSVIPEAVPFDLRSTDRLLATTRSVRKRLDFDRPVEPDVILDCLRLAVQAPTAGHSQGWRWMIVTEQALKDAIADIYREGGRDWLEQQVAEATTPQTRKAYEGAIYLAENLQRAPVFVIPCLNQPVASSNAEAATWYGSVIPAAWSFQLSLRSRGLGSVWTTGHLFQERKVADVLGIPEDVTQVVLLPVAYTRGIDVRPAQRPPGEEITYWNRWGDTL
jgi:nitroreductase